MQTAEYTTRYANQVTVLIVSGCDRELSTYHSFLQGDFRSIPYTIKAKSALEANQLCDLTLFDCILLDFELPDAGLVLEMADRVPVVVLLESEDEESIDRSIFLGAQDYLAKPNLTPELLYRTVHHSIERSKLRQKLAETNSIAQEQLSQHLAQAEERIKHQELELFSSERKFTNVFESAAIGMCLVSSEGMIVDANSAICQMLGYTKQELLALTFLQITYAEDLNLNLDYRLQALAGEISCYQMEKRYIHKNGQIIWGLLDVSLVRDSTQQPLYFSAQVQDISDRKRVSTELQEQTALLNTLIETFPDAIFLKDGLGRWLVANQAGLNLFELGEIDYHGKTDTELAEFSEFYREAFLYCQETDIAVWQEGSISTAEEILPQRDGSQKIFDSCKVPLFNTDGSRKGLVVVGRDITDRKKREDILQNIALGVSAKVGDDFFQSLVEYLCKALGVEFAFVTQIGESDDRYIQFVAGYGDGKAWKFLDYERAGTPCETIVGAKSICVYPNNVQKLFPSARDLVDLAIESYVGIPLYDSEGKSQGLLAIMSRQPLHDTKLIEEVLTIFAARVSSELERQQADAKLLLQEQRSRLFAEVTIKIRQSTELKKILQTTVTEIQKILQTDRVAIYQVNPDGSGKIVEESVVTGCMALFGKDDIYDPCFIGYFDRYAQRHISSIADIDNADIHPCHAEFLKQFEVKANLVVPILCKEKLWGLLIAHQCDRPRQWTDFETELLTQLSDQVSIAISSSQTIDNLRHSRELLFQKARREAALNRVVLAIRNSLDLDTIFATATVEITQILDTDSATIVKYFPEQHLWVHIAEHRCGFDMPSKLGFEIPDQDNPIAQRLKRSEIVIINDTSSIEDEINQKIAQTFPGSWLIIPLSYGGSTWGSLSLRRDQTSSHWQDDDIGLAGKIAAQLEIGIQQAKLYQQAQIEIADRKNAEVDLQQLNQQLERRVKRRTEALKYSKQILQLTIQSTPIGICTIDLKGQFLSVNQAICQIFGYSDQEMLNLSAFAITHPDSLEKSYTAVAQLIAGEMTSAQIEKQYIHQSGRVIDCISRLGLVRDPDGNPLHIVAGVEDITDRKCRDEELRSSLLEKEILLKEIHHRVKNNLQLVSSLLHLQEGVIQDPKILEPFRDSQQRVKAMALIHEHLYQSDNLANINFTKYVQSLATSLFQSYFSTSSHINLQLEIAEVKLEVNVAIPCGLIINELVSNAIKYAFPNRLQGEIYIIFTIDNEDRYTLTVKDNGVGVPADLDIHNTASLGLQIVCALTEQLEGSFELNPKGGTAFKITFPKP